MTDGTFIECVRTPEARVVLQHAQMAAGDGCALHD